MHTHKVHLETATTNLGRSRPPTFAEFLGAAQKGQVFSSPFPGDNGRAGLQDFRLQYILQPKW